MFSSLTDASETHETENTQLSISQISRPDSPCGCQFWGSETGAAQSITYLEKGSTPVSKEVGPPQPQATGYCEYVPTYIPGDGE